MTGPTTRARAQQEERFSTPAPVLLPQGERADPSGSQGPQGGRQEEELPPPPTMAQVLMQIERNRMDSLHVLEQIARNTAPTPMPAGRAGGQHGQGSLADFQRTNPPIFSSSQDPMEAEDWLREIEKKLSIAQCSDREKVLYASYQLNGPASIWWDNLLVIQPAGHTLTWEEFTEAFREAHIPEGVMMLKQQEFLALKQGRKSVTEYLHEFNSLARYAPDDVSTDLRRRNRFMNGLSEELQMALAMHDFRNFQHLVNKTLIAESKSKALEESRK